MRLLCRALRAPLLHFVVGGAVLFGAMHGTARVEPVEEPIVLTATDVARLRSDYTRDTGLEPTPMDEAALVDEAIEEQLLFREAVARGLDRNDRSVRNWLVEQMRVLADDAHEDSERLHARARALGLDQTDLVVRRILVQKMRLLAARIGERAPTDGELAAFYTEHRDDYRPPDRVSFWHVFVSSDSRRDAHAILETLRTAGRPPVEAMTAGDAFVLPSHVVAQSGSQVAKVFGMAFAEAVARADVGAWTEPIASPYGVHLVWVERREAGETPPLEAVRGRVVERWQEAERARRLVALLDGLKQRYPVRVQSSAWHGRRAS